MIFTPKSQNFLTKSPPKMVMSGLGWGKAARPKPLFSNPSISLHLKLVAVEMGSCPEAGSFNPKLTRWAHNSVGVFPKTSPTRHPTGASLKFPSSGVVLGVQAFGQRAQGGGQDHDSLTPNLAGVLLITCLTKDVK